MTMKPQIRGKKLNADLLERLIDYAPPTRGSDIAVTTNAGGQNLRQRGPKPAREVTFWARVIESQTTDITTRWDYEVAEQILTSNESAGWEDRPEGLTGTARNLKEVINSDSGLQGNGIDISTLPPGYALMPVPIGSVVKVHIVSLADGDQGWWFDYVNAVDGAC